MKGQKILQILKDNYQTRSLSHLYLIEPQFQDREQQIAHFLIDFLSSLGAKDPKMHEDIFWLEPTEKKHFLKDEMEPLYMFFKHPAHTLNRKFLIIENVLKISEVWINKLLKEFEEPAIDLTIFVTNPEKAEVLPTLRSRSILLRLPLQAKAVNGLSFNERQLEYKKLCSEYLLDFESIKGFLERMSKYLEESGSFEELEEFKSLMSAISIDREYNNPLQHSQFRIYTFLQKTL